MLFGATEDEDHKATINLLEKAFRGPITRAVNREVMFLGRNGVGGEPLLKALARIYDQDNLRDWVDRRSLHATTRPVPKIVCSEALVLPNDFVSVGFFMLNYILAGLGSALGGISRLGHWGLRIGCAQSDAALPARGPTRP